MTRLLLRPFRRFSRDTRGSMAVELFFVLPFYLWLILGIILYFYAFQLRTVSIQGANTIADLISREMSGPIGPSYIEGLDTTFNYLTNTSDNMGRIRVSMIRCTDKCGAGETGRVLDVDWSYGTNGLQPVTAAELAADLEAQIPIVPASEHLILVETEIIYTPPIWYDNSATTLSSVVPTRLRFVPQLTWDDGSGGTG